MKKYISFITILIVILVAVLLVPGCNKKAGDDIVIVYTTDVHCGVDDNIGYAALADYVNKTKETSKNFALIDAGDAMQGNLIGSMSKGKYIIDIMNKLNYDMYIIGNHEFDYGMDALSERINEFNGEFLSCNFAYVGQRENKFTKVKPYTIKDYGFAKVGFVGVTTPKTLTSSNPEHFKEDGQTVYSFHADDLFDEVQKNIDECHNQGCKYVILVSHLGYTENYAPYTSIDLITNTSGATCVIDGHAHVVSSCQYHKNKNGESIPLCDAGYKLNAFGRVTITKGGDVQVGIIESYPEKDQATSEYIDAIQSKIEAEKNKVVATSDLEMSIYNSAGVRVVRSRETALADVVADSYRAASGADIAFTNGGGVRTNLKSGDITYGNIKDVLPFDNTLGLIKVTGATLLDYLEYASSKTKSEVGPEGESGAFAQVSGMKYTIDISIESTVEFDASGNFIRVAGQRRVKDVYVYQNGEYVAIDPQKTYTVCSVNYIIFDCGDGATMFKDSEVVAKNIMLDSEAFTYYIVDILQGHLREKYETVGNRIIVE